MTAPGEGSTATGLGPARARRAVERSWGRFTALVDLPETRTGCWARPTRLAGWTVADLAVHAVWGVSMEADALRRARTGAPGAGEGRVVAPSSPPDAVAGELRAAVDALLAELARLPEGDADRAVPMPYGPLPLSVVLPILVMEAGVHADDLAAALGGGEGLDPDVCAATVPVLRGFLPVLATGAPETPPEGTVVAVEGPTVRLRFRFAAGAWSAEGGVEGGDEGGDEATATMSAADDSTILLYALGRTAPGDRRISVRGDARALAAFKRWLPGP